MICPKCRHAMHTFDRDGIHLEQCENCRGIYLDNGELEQILLSYRAHLQSELRQAPSPVPAPPPYQPAPMQAPHQPAPPSRKKKDDFWGDDDDFFGEGRDSRGRKKKDRWGFLDEIFG
nr:zf-TFIIB domain-containing protein [Nocardia sp. NRRL S-836]